MRHLYDGECVSPSWTAHTPSLQRECVISMTEDVSFLWTMNAPPLWTVNDIAMTGILSSLYEGNAPYRSMTGKMSSIWQVIRYLNVRECLLSL